MKKGITLFWILLLVIGSASTYAQSKTEKGKQDFAAGKYKEAEKSFSQALKSNPSDKEALKNRAAAREMNGDLLSAKADYNTLIKKDAKNAFAYAKRGYINNKLNNHKEAIADYSKAITLEPENAAINHAERGAAYLKLRNYRKAAIDFDMASKTMKNNAYLLYQHGICLLKIGQSSDALKKFNQSIKLSSGFTDAYLYRGIAYTNINKAELGIKDFDKVLQESSDYGEAYYERGKAYLKLKKTKLACEDLSKAKFYGIAGAKALTDKYGCVDQ